MTEFKINEYVNKNKLKITGDKIRRWKYLEETLNELEKKSLKNVETKFLESLGRLYNETLCDLGEVQSCNDEDVRLELYLNNLVARAYSQIYRKPGVGFKDFLNFFIYSFPNILKKRIHYFIYSFLIFLAATIIGYLCVNMDTKLVQLVVPKTMQSSMKAAHQSGQVGAEFPEYLRIKISSEIMFNNIKVSFYAFAMGVTFGIGTIIILIQNALLFGAFISIFETTGNSFIFWSLIIPHGLLELTLIFLCSGAGLILGYSLINSGVYSKKEWFVHEAHDAIRIVMGCIPFFMLAGLIEAYITPAEIGGIVKIIFGIIVFVFFIAYIIFFGKEEMKLKS